MQELSGDRKSRASLAIKIRSISLNIRLHFGRVDKDLVEDPITKQHQPRDYLSSLEKKVAMLEGLLQNVNPEVCNDHLVVSNNARPLYTVSTTVREISDNPDILSDDDTSGSSTARNQTNSTLPIAAQIDIADTLDHGSSASDLTSEIDMLCLNATDRLEILRRRSTSMYRA
ncbi:MAG: hypothetical protein M1834_000865 [Cirrosporium novae-zelandiae]|nr:MAG: hypothetical protein M1834_000865 [Cirrosporium novae-zelandiae]